MKTITTLALGFLTFCCSLRAQTPDLFINEFLASNGTGITDEAGDFEDWLEVYNAGNTPVDMGGMYLSDDLTDPTTWQIPTTDPEATTIPPGGYLVFFLDKEVEEGILHADIKLSAGGEEIGLYASDGITVIDSYIFGPQLEDISEGRNPDAGDIWAFYNTPTPGMSNDTPIGTGITEIPVADIPGGFYSGSLTISLTSETPDAQLYYTTDGTTPDEESTQYDGPIQITETTVIRAIAHKTGFDNSEVMTHTYLIDVDHNFTVVTMTTDPENLFNEDDGLFINTEEELEKPAHIQFFEQDGTLGFSQNIEIKLHGKATLELPQKSLAMKAKSSLGSKYFEYPIFPDQDIEQYRSFIMRQSGQDWNRSMFRDALMQNLMDDISDLDGIMKKPDLDLQAYRPAILYINGQYWGIQNIREQMTWKYINIHYDIEEEDLDVIENDDELKTGDLVEWDAFNDYLEDHNFSSDAMYQNLRTKADIDHFMDYMLHGIIVDNNDWPANNNRHWRERTGDGKWRWLSKDFDFGFGLRPLNDNWDSGDFTTDMVSVCLAESSTGYYNRSWSTLLLRRLMENNGAKNQFINRAADLLNTVFTADRVVARIDSLEALYIPEMQQHYDRWRSGYNNHEEKIEILRTFANGRFPEVRKHFVDYFDEISGTSDLTINANPVEGGTIRFNTLELGESVFPWQGVYFRGIEVPASAKSAPGFIFTGWSGAADSPDTDILVNLSSTSETLTANFILGSTVTENIVINEINYNSSDTLDAGDWVELYNPNNFPVDISGWYFEDESGAHFGLPANTIMAPGAFLLLVENEILFSSLYPAVTNVYGDFGEEPDGFGLSGKGEKIALKNAAGQLIDEVEYDDKLPWPEAPDGEGATLQLVAAFLDNSLPESWVGIEATPGAVNGGGLVLNCPNDIEISVLPGAVGAIADWTIDLPASGCPTGTTTLVQTGGPANGTLFPVGTTTVTYEASNDCEATATCSFDVIITEDTGSILVICPEDQQINTLPGQTSVVVTWPEPKVFTTCPFGPEVEILQDSGPANGSVISAPGAVVTYIVTDFCGNVEECRFRISVSAVPATVSIDCPEDISVISTDGQGQPVTWDTPAASTNCSLGGIVSLVQTGGPASGSLFPVGTTTVAYEAVDACDASNNCSFTVTITEDIGILTADCVSDQSVSTLPGDTAAIVTWPEPTGTTTCPAGETITVLQTSGPANGSAIPVPGATINYLLTDNCGNVDSCSFKVMVNEILPTVSLSCPEDISVISPDGEDQAVSWDTPDAGTDCAQGEITSIVQTSGPASGSLFPVGTTTVTYEAVDACGTMAMCSFEISVTEGANGISMNCPEDLDVVLPPGANSQAVSWDPPMVSSTCGGGTTGNNNCGSVLSGFNYAGSFDGHEYYVSTDKLTWTDAQTVCATFGGRLAILNSEAKNNFITENVSEKVYIGLTDKNMEGTPEWENGVPVTYTNFASGADNDEDNDYAYYQPWDGKWSWYADFIRKFYLLELECGSGGLEVTQIDGPASGSVLTPGNYNITYQAVDVCGGISNCSFNISVENNPQSLIIGCPEDITVSETNGSGGAIVSWASATATNDNCTGIVNVQQIVGPASGSFFAVGSHVVTYRATDECSNVEDCSFVISVLPEVIATEYCESAGSRPWQERIINVTFAGINNASGKDGYGNFTDLIANVEAATTYPISILPKFSYAQYDSYFRVWIDTNQDFDFTDPGELVYEVFRPAGTSGTDATPLTGTVRIPAGAAAGFTRMRVSMKRDAYAEPCEAFEFGEVEDYTVSISSSEPAEGVTEVDNMPVNNANQTTGKIDEQTMISSNHEKQLRVYPNPVKASLMVDLTAWKNETIYLKIYNGLGQLTWSDEINGTDVRLQSVDLSRANNGLYLVTVTDREGSRTAQQIIVDK